jgi:hypothetical protein
MSSSCPCLVGVAAGDSAVLPSLAIASRKSRPMNGLVWTKAGRWAHCQSGRVVVDSQSIMHVCDGELSGVLMAIKN